jgi:hypothetical protein
MEFTEEELADKIEALVKRKYPRLQLSDEDICEMLFGHALYRQQVNAACRRLISEQRLDRDGKGVAGSPFWYRPWGPPFERRI